MTAYRLVTEDALALLQERWALAAARIDAEYAALTPAQRRAPLPYRRSARVDAVRRAYGSLHHPARQLRQISLERLGFSPEDTRAGGVLHGLYVDGVIGVLSDRHRHPHTVYWRAASAAA